MVIAEENMRKTDEFKLRNKIKNEKTNMENKEMVINGIVYVPKETISTQKTIELTDEDSVWEIGKYYLIKTTTLILLGRVVQVTDKELNLSGTYYLTANNKNFFKILETGIIEKVEMLKPNVIVGRNGTFEAIKWRGELPKQTGLSCGLWKGIKKFFEVSNLGGTGYM